jgi:hypothetical protein
MERKKLYGWTELLALDDSGNECKLVSMDESGTLIIPRGGIGLGMLSSDSRWVERSELVAVNGDNTPATLMKSSYDITIELGAKVTPEEFLDYSINAFYRLEVQQELVDALKDGIYTFIYNYREAYEGNRAFLIVSEDSLYMLIGTQNIFEMLSLEQAGVLEESDEEEPEEEDTEIDFSMF